MHSRFKAWIAVGAVAAAALAWAIWQAPFVAEPGGGQEPAPEGSDPRLTFDTPYENVHPSVKYVDDARCAECHEEIAQAYLRHPMRNTLSSVAAAGDVESLDASHNNPFARDGY